MDITGTNITPESNTINSYGGTFETILTADQAADYSYEKMFAENQDKTWDPASLTKQIAAPANLKINDKTLSWDANAQAMCWAVFKDGEFAGITESNSFAIDDSRSQYTVRAANKMGGLGEASSTPLCITISKAGYCTFFDSKNSYAIPAGVKAMVVTQASADALTYTELKDVIPAGTAVLLQSSKKDATFAITVVETDASYTGVNLLKGSDVATTTFSDFSNCQYYKLSFGPSNTEYSNVFGWFWGAEDGAAFQIEPHRAWLTVPASVASTRGYGLDSSTTGISISTVNTVDNDVYHNLQGQRVKNPVKGLYIHNNKKIIIK
jgi:hypothetical protein